MPITTSIGPTPGNLGRGTMWERLLNRFAKLTTEAALPTTTQLAEDEWIPWKNTALTGDRRVWLNDAGIMYSIPFSMIERTTIPGTGDVPSGCWTIWKNTTLSGGVAANTVKIWVNDNGVMKSVTLA